MWLNVHIVAFLFIIFLHENNAKNVRIVNGTNAGSSEFPFMVSLQNNTRHICGGSILNRKFLLTAAHCVCNFNVSKLSEKDNFVAVFGYSLSKVENTRIRINKVVCHSYSPLEHINDIAILELDIPIPTNIFHSVILSPIDFDTLVNHNGTLVGWGYNETNGEINTILQKVNVFIYNDSICKASYSSIYNMDLNMCAGWPDDGKGSCQGDSGGPLLYGDDQLQVGIISRGATGNCGISNPNQPKILTRISKYLEWISNNTEYIVDDKDESNSVGSVICWIRYPKMLFIALSWISIFTILP